MTDKAKEGPTRARAIAVLGTASDVGKSLIAVALGRLLADAGLNVAPFKAQNMALQAGVTPDGGEMGRAQILQAEACRQIPHVDMNPVLLKPESDRSPTRASAMSGARPARSVSCSPGRTGKRCEVAVPPALANRKWRDHSGMSASIAVGIAPRVS